MWYNPSLTLEGKDIKNIKLKKIVYLSDFFELFLLINAEKCDIIYLIE